MVDVIIPILNEGTILDKKKEYYQRLGCKANLMFVDGGSTDRSPEIARRYGTVIRSLPGRSIQKNCGAGKTQSPYLLFLHVDAFIPIQVLNDIEQVCRGGAIGGCLTMRIEDRKPLFRVYEQIVTMRAKVFGIIDGDLGMFVRRDVFERLGGFDRVSVMEDILFAKKLVAIGKINVLRHVIRVSSRKWDEQGFIKTFFEYTRAYIKLWRGPLVVSPKTAFLKCSSRDSVTSYE